VKIGLAQLNPTVGDLAGNVDRCRAAVCQAAAQGADLVVLPEMVLPGYPPRDILCDEGFGRAVAAATRDLARLCREGPPVLAGTFRASGRASAVHPGWLNVAALLQGGEIRAEVAKRLLPGYDVFFEPRWFLPGPPAGPLEIAGRKVGVLVCEDLWDEAYPEHPPAELVRAGAEVLVCLSACPWRRGIRAERQELARTCGVPLVYVNACGGNDELIFDGHSFARRADGRLAAHLPGFAEAVGVVDLDGAETVETAAGSPEEELFEALVLGVGDFVRKNGVERVFIGLSGGLDSSVVAVIAARALDPARVTGVAIPSRFTDPRSTECARELAAAVGISFEVFPLEPLHAAAEAALGPLLEGGTGGENAQARLRALVLLAMVNRRGGMLLNTSNKTELALGYGTLHGDLAGTLSPLGDVNKLEVMALGRWIHEQYGLIPPFVLERPPSAELRPGQVDPFDYAEVAPALDALVRANRSDGRMRRSEHKRWQAGVILRVSEKAFGRGRMIPITRK